MSEHVSKCQYLPGVTLSANISKAACPSRPSCPFLRQALWTAMDCLDCLYGLPGLPLWTVSMDCLCGLPLWTAFEDCLSAGIVTPYLTSQFWLQNIRSLMFPWSQHSQTGINSGGGRIKKDFFLFNVMVSGGLHSFFHLTIHSP